MTAEPPELWLFVASNLLLLVLGGTITVLSYGAYRRNEGRRALRDASIGFGLITVGSLVEGVYELGIRGYELGGRELLALHTVEGVLIAGGLAIIFYSLYAR
jgi:hypothetical protein